VLFDKYVDKDTLFFTLHPNFLLTFAPVKHVLPHARRIGRFTTYKLIINQILLI